jgi:hypothetical protein
MLLTGEVPMVKITQGKCARATVEGSIVGNEVVLTTFRLVIFNGSPDSWVSVLLPNILLVERRGSTLKLVFPEQHEAVIECVDRRTASIFAHNTLNAQVQFALRRAAR